MPTRRYAYGDMQTCVQESFCVPGQVLLSVCNALHLTLFKHLYGQGSKQARFGLVRIMPGPVPKLGPGYWTPTCT